MTSNDTPRSSLAVCVWTAVCFGWLVIAWSWNAVYLTMTVDDTFYYFKTALNVSRGIGSSFDGINATNGYHPLWLSVLAVVFLPLQDRDMVFLSRVVISLQTVIVWVAGLVLASLGTAGGSRLLWLFSLMLINPFVAKIVLCGQETALQLLMSSVAIAYWWTLRSSTRRYTLFEWAGLALACVLATFARLDTIFLGAILLAMPLLLPSDNERAEGFGRRLLTAVVGFGVLLLGLLPYLAFNQITFGHAMPVSGAIKFGLNQDEVASLWARSAVSVVAIAGAVALWMVARRGRSAALPLFVPPIAFALVVAIYNFGVRGEMSLSLVRIWYLEPYVLAGVLIGGGALARSEWRRPTVLVSCGIVSLWVMAAAEAWRYRIDPRSYSLYAAAERCSRWFDQHSESHALGAAWDAGFAGAFTDKPVMNLDGLISSWEFKRRYLDTGKVDDFVLRDRPVDYVIQYMWPNTLRRVANRFGTDTPPSTPQAQTSVIGEHDRSALSSRWGVDLASFYVAHDECVMLSVAFRATSTIGPVRYFVLSRAPLPGRPTLAQYAVATAARRSCESS